jgi:hypothetical protein
VDVHGGVDVPAPGLAPPQAQTASSPLPVMVVADSGLGASAASQCGRAFPRLDAATTPSSPSLSRRAHW